MESSYSVGGLHICMGEVATPARPNVNVNVEN